MVIVPNLITFDQYNLLGDYLVQELGYEREKNFIEFAYDWRQDVRQSARRAPHSSMAGTRNHRSSLSLTASARSSVDIM